MRCEHYDRYEFVAAVRRVADEGDELNPIQDFHLVVDNDNVDRIVAQAVKSFGCVTRFKDVYGTEPAQDRLDDMRHVAVVVDNQKPHAC